MIKNIIDFIVPWYFSFVDDETLPSSYGVNIADSFIKILTRLVLSR